MERLSPVQVSELVDHAPIAHVGVVVEGRPYVTPLSFVVIDGVFYFRTATGRRLQAIEAGSAACVEICRYDPQTGHWASVVAMGDAYVVNDPKLEAEVSQALLRKYEALIGSPLSHSGLIPLLMERYVVAFSPTEVTGLSSGAGISPGLRPGRL